MPPSVLKEAPDTFYERSRVDDMKLHMQLTVGKVMSLITIMKIYEIVLQSVTLENTNRHFH